MDRVLGVVARAVIVVDRAGIVVIRAVIVVIRRPNHDDRRPIRDVFPTRTPAQGPVRGVGPPEGALGHCIWGAREPMMVACAPQWRPRPRKRPDAAGFQHDKPPIRADRGRCMGLWTPDWAEL